MEKSKISKKFKISTKIQKISKISKKIQKKFKNFKKKSFTRPFDSSMNFGRLF